MSSQGTLASLRRRIASTGLPGGDWNPPPDRPPPASSSRAGTRLDDDALTLFRARLADGDERAREKEAPTISTI